MRKLICAAVFCTWFTLSGFGVIVTISTGINLLGDTFLNAPASLGTLLPNPNGILNGSQVFIYQCSAGFTNFTIDNTWPSGWGSSDDSMPADAPVINPGEGFIINNLTGLPYLWDMEGSPGLPILPPANYCGCGQWSLLCPQNTNTYVTYQQMTGFPPLEGAQVSFNFTPGSPIIADDTYMNGAWSPSTPLLTNGQAAFFYSPCTNNCINLQCPPDMTVMTCSNCAVVYFTATATNTCCTNDVTLTYNPDSGSCFPLGTNLVQVTATDGCGNVATCSFMVNVLPGTNCSGCIQMQCWSNLVVSACTNVPVYYYPTATDLCCSNLSVVCSPTNGSLFAPDTTNTVLVVATDDYGNTNACSFTVTVQCITTNECPCTASNRPVIVNGCFDNGLSGWTPSGKSGTVFVVSRNDAYQEGRYAPAYYFVDLGISATPNYNTGAYLEQTVSGFTVGQPMTLSFWYSVEYDSGPPNAAASTPALEVAVTGNSGSTPSFYNQVFFGGNPHGTTPTPAYWTKVSMSFTPTDPTLTFRFTDTSSTGIDPQIDCVCLTPGTNFNTCSNGCITIQNPADLVQYSCTNTPVYYFPQVTDTCCSNWSVVCSPTNGSLFAPGTTTTVTTLAWDTCGNSNACSFTVSLLCPTNPCISLTSFSNKTVSCDTNWNFDPPANIVDYCCGNFTVSFTTVTNSAPCPFVETRTWTVADACGNSTNCSQTVTIVSCVPPPSGMINWWPGDSNTLDIVSGNNGTINGTVTYAGGMVGSAFDFNGSGGWVQSAGVSQSQAAGTVDFWFNVNSWNWQSANNGIFLWANTEQLPGGDFDGMNLGTHPQYTSTGELLFGIYAGGWNWAHSGVVPQPNTWYHVAGTWGPAGIKIYINGQLMGSSSYTGPSPGYTLYNLIGRSSWPGTQISGLVDEVEIFNRALAPGEIAAIYNAGPAGKCKSPVVACPSYKTVECGSIWSFDPPVVTGICEGTNTVTALTPITNGVCPQIITENWVISNSCFGTIYNCSQQVMVIDTTPPVIDCPTNSQIVALNKNCQFVIPYVSVTATDACTPPCSLVYSQSPTNGTIVPGHTADVVVTVTDLCGNSSQCTVHLVGEDRTGPVVTCPPSMTVTNCLVPCVPVSAEDSCCPRGSLVVTQSPPCGTQAGPGVNSVTVTVTDCNGNSTTKVVHLDHSGTPQSFLGTLYNTGVDPNRALLPDAAEDTHYGLPPSAVPAGMPVDYYGYAVAVSDASQSAAPAPDTCHWTDNPGNGPIYHYVPWGLPPDPATAGSGAVSKWIGPDFANNSCCPAASAVYTYTQTFLFPGNLDSSTAWLAGRGAADNAADIYLNGNYLGSLNALSRWDSFQSAPGMIVPGQNTLKFEVINTSHWTGLRVEITNAVAGCATCAPPTIRFITSSMSALLGSSPLLSVTAEGSAPFSYQWQFNSGNIAGANNSTLQLHSVNYSAAGIYTVIVSNACGITTANVRLSVYKPMWPSALWNVGSVVSPLVATYGPDLILTGPSTTTNYAISSGTTEDFGLPEVGGQIANVMDINPQAGAQILIPPVAPAGSNSVDSYTVIMDIYQPGNAVGTPTTLFQSQSGPGGIVLSLDASNYVHVADLAGGVPADTASATPMQPATWNRLALVVSGPTAGLGGSAIAYLNGLNNIVAYSCPCCVLTSASSVNWSSSSPIVFSGTTNEPNGELYVSSLQFHAVAMSAAMIAGLDSPDSGPAPGSDLSAPAQPPILSAVDTNGTLSLTWTGSSYDLQETTDLTSGSWAESAVPFTETLLNGNIVNSAIVNPAPGVPAKFYRLAFRP